VTRLIHVMVDGVCLNGVWSFFVCDWFIFVIKTNLFDSFCVESLHWLVLQNGAS